PAERWHDQKGYERDGRTELDELLSSSLLRRRIASQPALKKCRVPSHEIERNQGRCAQEDRQVHPSLPLVNGPRGHEQQKAHHNAEDSKCEPCPCTRFPHSAFCP